MNTSSSLSLTPKLSVRGADAAIAFYAQALGAACRERYAMGESVVFARLELPGGASLQIKDEDSVDPSPATLGGRAFLVDVVTDDPDALAQAFVAAGGEIVFEVDDQPYGIRQGRVRDPFGHEWILGTRQTMTPEQVQAALDAAGA